MNKDLLEELAYGQKRTLFGKFIVIVSLEPLTVSVCPSPPTSIKTAFMPLKGAGSRVRPRDNVVVLKLMDGVNSPQQLI